MKKAILNLLVILTFFPSAIFSQKENYNWTLSNGCAITFNTPDLKPQIIENTTPVLFPSTISDSKGNLLFYCGNTSKDCFQLMNWNNEPIFTFKTNGVYMIRNCIINYPGKKDHYVLIIHRFVEDKLALFFYVIDKKLNGGKGGVIDTFLLFPSPQTPSLSGAFKHSNGVDWWIITGDDYLYQFKTKSYLFTSKGIIDSVESNLPLHEWWDMYIPIVSFNVDLSNMPLIPYVSSSTYGELHFLEFALFNRKTGKFQYVGGFKICDSCGISFAIFSPGKKKIYTGQKNLYPTPYYGVYLMKYEIYQYTYSDDFQKMEQSKVQIGPTKTDYIVLQSTYPPIKDPDGDKPKFYNYAKLGPNGNIYICNTGGDYISEISNADADAKDVVFKDTALYLGKKYDEFSWTVYNGYNLWLDLTSNSPVCIGDSIRLSFTISDTTKKPTKIRWEGPNGFTSNKANPVFLAERSGYYKVSVTVNDAEIIDSIWVEVFKPEPKIIAPKTICLGDTIEISVDKEFASYWWSTGETSRRIKVFRGGHYSVFVTDSNGCIGADSALIVEDYIKAIIKGNTTFCKGKSTSLEAYPKGSQYKYLWSTGEITESIEVYQAGTYWVVVSDSLGCKGTDTVVVEELQNLTFSIIGDTLLCPGETITLSAPLSGKTYSYKWSTGESSKSIKINKGGLYWLFIQDENGCFGYDTILVHELPKPEAKIIPSDGKTSLCKGGTKQLFAQPQGNFSYLWSNGETNEVIVITQGGTYQLVVTNEFGCKDTAEIKIIEVNPIIPKILGDTSICDGGNGILSIEGNFVSFLWSTGDTTRSITISKAGNYTAEVVDSNGCRTTAKVSVNEYKIELGGLAPINFVNEVSSTKEINLQNLSNSKIRVKNIKFKQNSEEFKVDVKVPTEIAIGGEISFKVYFESKGKLLAMDTIIVEVDAPCNKVFEIPIFAKISEVKTTIWLPDTTGIIGTKGFCIPLYAKSDGIPVKNLSFKATIRYDARALQPEDQTYPIENGERVVSLSGSEIYIDENPKEIGRFCGEILLPPSEKIPLRIVDFQWLTNNIEATPRDGSLTVKGICMPNMSQIELFQPIEISLLPNPTNDEIEITLKGNANTKYLLKITNAIGCEVEEREVTFEKGQTNIKIDLRNYSSGLYFLQIGNKFVKFYKI
ncbi:MAG: hypothetical protein CH6_3529 [Candidatus Kapaibacterium sp.]|nr:MAG: hypothetical protein CH6_3529 [Candidatus Kapabacteria bacterium]